MNILFDFAWPISATLVERLGWVLVHSLWQLAAVALLAGLAVRAMRRRSASARYGVLLVALALVVAAPIATWLCQPDVASSELVSRVARAPRPETSGVAESIVADRTASDSPVPDHGPVAGAPGSEPPALPPIPALQESPSWSEEATALVRPWLAWIVAGWSIGVVLCSLRPLLGWHMLRRLRREGVSPPTDEVLAAVQRVSQRLGLRRAVQVLQSTLAQVPVVVGYLRPVILLPTSVMTGIPVAQLEAILAHELAHVRRHDFVINLLQTLVETIFFYHPAVWWLSRQVRVEREHCCDDLVVALLGNRIEYGRALVAIEELRGQTPPTPPYQGGDGVLALGAADGSLLSRVRRIVGVEAGRNAHSLIGRWPPALLGLTCLGAALAVSMSWSLAAKDDEESSRQPVLAKLPGNITVELVGVGFHPSKDREWWRPDGGKLEQQPQLKDQPFIDAGSLQQAQFRELLIQIRGLPRDQYSIRTELSPDVKSTGTSFSYEGGVWVGRHIAGPFDSKTTAIRVGLTTEPFGPLVTIDAAGRKQAGALAKELAPFYDRIVPLGVGEAEGKPELLLESSSFKELATLAECEVRAIDVDGKAYERQLTAMPSSGAEPSRIRFDLPRGRLARFEYRVRPYQHFVTFDNVSLNPGQKTKVTVATESKPIADAGVFGPESNGLRCRLVAVPTTADDESPDITKTATTFARGDDVAFAAELKNVSDKPVTLLGVRNGDSSSAAGKLYTERRGPPLFDFEFTDSTGKPVPRTERAFEHEMISGASVHEVAPGKSLIVLLRPAKFNAPMDHRFLPGNYRAKVRYHGPSATTLAEINKRWPGSVQGKAWSREVTSNEVAFNVAADPAAPKPPKLVWGPVKDGLQAAIEIRVPRGVAGVPTEPPGVPLKTRLGVVFHVKNVSDKPITFPSETLRQGDQLRAKNEAGELLELGTRFYTGTDTIVRWKLKPGDIAELHVLHPAINGIEQPGKYAISYTIPFNSRHFRVSAGNIKYPLKDDWQSKLETGKVPLFLRARKAADGAPGKPIGGEAAPESGGKNAKPSAKAPAGASVPQAGKTGVDLMVKFSSAEYFWQQADVARELIALGDRKIIPQIEKHLDTEDRCRRCNAAMVLAGLGDKRGLAVILAEFKDRTSAVAASSRGAVQNLAALGKFGRTDITRHCFLVSFA